MILKLLFIVTVFIYLIACIWYYNHQNKQSKIGGPIAKPKIFWLGFASYNYFILSLILFWGIRATDAWVFLLQSFVVLVFLRAVIQSLLMFVFHRWIPPMGIIYNFVCLTFLIVYYLINRNSLTLKSKEDILLGVFLLEVACILLVDSIYAFKFYKIVGEKTKGKDAIWYASEEDPSFKKVIQLTRYLNILFMLYFIFFTFKLITL